MVGSGRGCRVRRLGGMRYLAVAAPCVRDRCFSAGFTAGAFSRAVQLGLGWGMVPEQIWRPAGT